MIEIAFLRKASVAIFTVLVLLLAVITPPAANSAIASESSTGPVKVERKKTGLIAESWPVTRPQLVEESCSPGAIRLTYKSRKAFKMPGTVTHYIAAPERAFGPGTSMQISGWSAFTKKEPLKRVAPTNLAINFQVCASDVPLGTEPSVTVRADLRDGKGKLLDRIEITVPISDSDLSISMNRFVSKCLDRQNPANLTVAQTKGTSLRRNKWTDAIIGATAKLEGTLFINNVAVKNTEIVFFEEFKNSNGAWQLPGNLIARTRTDELGQFEVTLKLTRVYPESTSTVTAAARPSLQVLGPGAVAMPGASFEMKFDWLLSPGYYIGNKYDMPPVPDQDCSEAYEVFINQIDEEDEQSRLSRYVVIHEAGRWFNGYKERGRYTAVQCYDQSWGAACNYFETGIAAPNTATSFGNLGSRCWHRQGHTRRLDSGKVVYVNSHRACRN